MDRKYEQIGECGGKEEDLAPTATVTSQTAGEGFAPSPSLNDPLCPSQLFKCWIKNQTNVPLFTRLHNALANFNAASSFISAAGAIKRVERSALPAEKFYCLALVSVLHRFKCGAMGHVGAAVHGPISLLVSSPDLCIHLEVSRVAICCADEGGWVRKASVTTEEKTLQETERVMR